MLPAPRDKTPVRVRSIAAGGGRRGEGLACRPDRQDVEPLAAGLRSSGVRIVQVIGDGTPGGGATVVLGLARALARSGVAVTVASAAGSYILDEAGRAGIPVVELDFRRRRRSIASAQLLQRHLRLSAPALVHAHGARAGLPVAMMTKSPRLPIAYTVHGFHFPQKAPVARHFARLAERYCIRQAWATVFVCRHDAEIAGREGLIGGDDRWEIIRNGSAWAEPHAAPPRFDIVYLGRLVAGKNPLLLPRILLALRPARPSLCVIGDGEEAEALRNAFNAAGLAGQVTFLGSVPQPEAMSCLSGARVLILPSRSEGLPMCVLEAAHRGVPAVASKVGGTPEIVVDGETGYLVEAGDVERYADRLRRLLEDESLRRRMGAHALARAREEFSLERQLSSYLSLYSRLAAAATARQGCDSASPLSMAP